MSRISSEQKSQILTLMEREKQFLTKKQVYQVMMSTIKKAKVK